MKELWVEKYRPNTLDDYVFLNDRQKRQVEHWVNDGAIPHLLFSGNPGTGKTTLAKVLFNCLNVDPGDILEVDASKETGIDNMRDKISHFVSTFALGDMKYVLLDEADYLSPNAQAHLRSLTERYNTTSRFVLTCNFPNRIIDAIHSRCQGFHFDSMDINEMTVCVVKILSNENIDFDLDVLDDYVKAKYPDLRKTINTIQQNSVSGTLLPSGSSDSISSVSDYMVQVVRLFKDGKYYDGRKLLLENARPEEYTDVYRFLYRNVDLWGETQDIQDQAIIIVNKAICNNVLAADPEINMASCLIELNKLGR